MRLRFFRFPGKQIDRLTAALHFIGASLWTTVPEEMRRAPREGTLVDHFVLWGFEGQPRGAVCLCRAAHGCGAMRQLRAGFLPAWRLDFGVRVMLVTCLAPKASCFHGLGCFQITRSRCYQLDSATCLCVPLHHCAAGERLLRAAVCGYRVSHCNFLAVFGIL